MNRVSVINDYIEVSIEIDNSALTGQEFVDELVMPLMLALGYQPETVNEVLGVDKDI